MPYIKPEVRAKIIAETTKATTGQVYVSDFVCRVPTTTGELNYLLTRMTHELIKRNKLSYDLINSMIGVLECCKLELYRMVAAPYENKKRMENGPVSDLDAKSLEDVR